jgi:hypothetical protein
MASRSPHALSRLLAHALLTAHPLRTPCAPFAHPLRAPPCVLQPPSRAEASLQAAAEPLVTAAHALRILCARVLPPQPLLLQLRAGGWGGSYGAAEDGRWDGHHIDGQGALARVPLVRPATQPLYALVRALGPAVMPQ